MQKLKMIKNKKFWMVSLIASILLSAHVSWADNEQDIKRVDYHWVSKRLNGISAFPTDDGITVFGLNSMLHFDDKINCIGKCPVVGEHFGGPLPFEGYIEVIKPLSDDSIIVAGLDHKGKSIGLASLLGDDDNRRAFIAKLNPKLKVEKFLTINNAISYGLDISVNNQIVLLSGGRGHYTLTLLDRELNEIDSTTFGGGLKGDIAITSEGNYAVVGFERSKDNHSDLPTYWEYSPKLELVAHKVLAEKGKPTGDMDGFMRVLEHDKEVYIIYGWENCRRCKPNSRSFWIEKIKGSGTLWGKNQPYSLDALFFISPDGNPYILEPKQGAIHQTIFNKNDGKISNILIERPKSPVECFPPDHYYEILGAFPTDHGETNIVLTCRPLESYEAGCVTVGKVKL
jgi:hypothetical protein